jgi:hypothetical protein
MGYGIYRFRFDIVDRGFKIRGQARSPRGTMYTCDSMVVDTRGLGRDEKAAALAQGLDSMAKAQHEKRS